MPATPTQPVAASDRSPEAFWPLVRIAAVTALLFATMAIVPPSTDALVRQRFGLGNEAVSLFFIAHSLPQVLLLGLFIGLLSDRLRRRIPLALAGAVATGFTTMATPFLSSFGALIALRLVDGATGIAALGLLMTRAVDLSTPATRSRTMALYLAAIPIGYLSGSFAMALFGADRWHLAFPVVGALLVVASLLLAIDLRRPEPISALQPGVRQIVASLRGAPRLLFPCFFGFMDKFTFALLALLTGLALSDRYQLSAIVWGGSALGLLWVAFLLASAPAARITRRLGAWRTVAVGSAGYGVLLVLLVAFDSPLVFVATLTLAGAFVALQTIPTYVLVGDLAGRASRATAMAAFNLVGSFGIMAGFAFAGWASETFGYLVAFAIGGGLELLSAIVALIAWRRWCAGQVTVQSPAPSPPAASAVGTLS